MQSTITVEAISEATIRILLSRGADRLTTTRAADSCWWVRGNPVSIFSKQTGAAIGRVGRSPRPADTRVTNRSARRSKKWWRRWQGNHTDRHGIGRWSQHPRQGLHPTNSPYRGCWPRCFARCACWRRGTLAKTRPLRANRLLGQLVLRRLRVQRRDKAFCCGRRLCLVNNYNILRRDFLPVDSLVCVVVRSDGRPLKRNSCK